MDNRTLDEFKRDIKNHTEKEKIAAQILKVDIEKRGKKVILENNGMDNSGKLIIDSKKVNANPDYKFIIDGKETLIEIKVHSEKYSFFTFKECDIKTYIKKDACIAIVRETGRYIMSVDALKYIIENYKKCSYHGFAAGKPSYRIYANDMSDFEKKKLVAKKDWTPEAKKLIDENKEKLFGAKK
jgi:hypothetical protein